ncbi:MAG: TonB family protein [Planctomycetota bacterium]|nr:TonB family protein [Planctomycetota bacterium]
MVHGSLLLVLVLVYAAVPPPPERRGAFQTVAFVEPCVDEACEPVADELPEEDPVDDLELTPLVEPDDVTPEDDTELPLVEPERAVLHEPPTLAAHEVPLSAVKRREPKPVARPRPTAARPVARRPVQARPAAQPRGRTKLKLVSRPSLLSYYPAEARRQGIEGEALVEILVDASGTVTRATLVRTSGSALLDRQALKVMYAYRFEPGARGRARVPVSFRLR